MKPATKLNDQYFATLQNPDELASALQEKIRIWREWCAGYGLITVWRRKLANYYGMSAGGNTSQVVTRGGSEGELNMIKVNDLHQLVQEQLVIVTSQRPAGQARAINSNSTSLKDARIGTAVAEYYMSQANFESQFVSAAEIALLCDEAFMDLAWDKNAGDPIAVDPTTGMPEMSGDATLRVHCPWNVSRDPGMAVKDQRWHILSFRVNKWDMMAQFPKFSDQIMACTEEDLPGVPMNDLPEGSDTIYAHLLVHDRTPAVPEGRYSLMIGDYIVLDTVLPYKDYPVERISPSDVIDGATGYAPSNDIMGLEEITDALHSIITTNQITFGGQVIVGPQGSDLKYTDLGKGVRYFELPPDHVDKLRPLQLTKTAPEIFNYVNLLQGKKEKAVGSVSSVLAAQAQQGASGNSMALIQTQSISYNSGIQRSYFRLLSAVMTKLIGILRKYADTPRVAKIVGKSKSQGLKEFKYTGQDLNSISSIVYEMVNPMSQTFGGRLTFAQDLIKANMIKSPKQYITVATTGQLDPLMEDDVDDQLMILEENEALNEGRFVKAIITENHADHIKSHLSQITQEMKEKDPEAVSRILAHVQEHIDAWTQASQMNPGILAATGQQPIPMAPPAAPGAPGAPQGPGELMGDGQAPAVQQAADTNLPSLPNVAGTNEPPVVPGVTDAGLA